MQSMGHNVTFPETADAEILRQTVLGLCKAVCAQLQDRELRCARARVRVRFADWTDIQRVLTLRDPGNDVSDVFPPAWDAIQRVLTAKRTQCAGKAVQAGFADGGGQCPAWFVRLLGVSCLQWVRP